MKICSFLPSATEMLFAIGAGDEVVGVTFECDYPAAAQTRPQVVFSRLPPGLTPAEIDAIVSAEGAQGRSLYFVDLPRLEALQPDLIILQDLCRVCAIDSPTLARDLGQLPSSPRVISLAAHTLTGVLAEIDMLGEAVGRATAASRVTQALRARIDAVIALPTPTERPRVLCLEWLDPLFQGGHWIPEMVELAGGEAVLATAGEKSIRISWEAVAEADPEIVVMMPCGYHLAETVTQFNALPRPPFWEKLTAVREGHVYAVDGTAYFSRPGPRLVDGLEIMAAIVRGQEFSALPPHSVLQL